MQRGLNEAFGVRSGNNGLFGFISGGFMGTNGLRRICSSFLALLTIILLALPGMAAKAPTSYEAIFKSAHDGDTYKIVRADNKEITIRLMHIDAPELGQTFGAASTQFATKMLANQHLFIVDYGHDKYGRTLAEVFLIAEGGHLLIDWNRLMVSCGCAWVYKTEPISSNYWSLQGLARVQELGLWGCDQCVEPWEYRKNKKQKKEAPATSGSGKVVCGVGEAA